MKFLGYFMILSSFLLFAQVPEADQKETAQKHETPMQQVSEGTFTALREVSSQLLEKVGLVLNTESGVKAAPSRALCTASPYGCSLTIAAYKPAGGYCTKDVETCWAHVYSYTSSGQLYDQAFGSCGWPCQPE